MKIQDALVTKNEVNLLFIDPGNICTGWAIYSCTRVDVGGERHIAKGIKDYGKIKTPDHAKSVFIEESKLLQSKIDYICSSTLGVAQSNRVGRAIIELPSVVYGGGKVSRQQVLAKGQSLMKLAALAFSIRMNMINHGFSTVEVLPSQWQVHHSKRKGMDSKEWSLKIANGIVEEFLHTKEDENIADAITMGDVLIPKFIEGTLDYGD